MKRKHEEKKSKASCSDRNETFRGNETKQNCNGTPNHSSSSHCSGCVLPHTVMTMAHLCVGVSVESDTVGRILEFFTILSQYGGTCSAVGLHARTNGRTDERTNERTNERTTTLHVCTNTIPYRICPTIRTHPPYRVCYHHHRRRRRRRRCRRPMPPPTPREAGPTSLPGGERERSGIQASMA
jgi:hypothetical protein